MPQDYVDVPLTPIQKRKATDVANDFLIGAAKGLAETTTNVVGIIPGVTTATRAVGNYLGGKAAELAYGTASPPVSGEQVEASLAPTNTAQQIGKGVEQVGEFFVSPQAGFTGLESRMVGAGIEHGVQPLIRAAHGTQKAVEGVLKPFSVAAAHGDEHPERAAAITAAGPVIGTGAQAATGLIKYPISQQLLGILGGVAGSSLFGSITPAALGASLGAGFAVFSLSKTVARRVLSNPEAVQAIRALAMKGSVEAARLLAALNSVAGPEGSLEPVKETK